MKNIIYGILAIVLATTITDAAKPTKKASQEKDNQYFYVYSNKGSKDNHFIPSGWMGAYQGIRFDGGYKDDCLDGTCIKIVYDPKKTQQTEGWHGIYFQSSDQNWGNKPQGHDLTGYKRLTFWAKATTDNVQINEFKMGGISGEFGDTDGKSIGPVTLEKNWKKYTIDVKDLNLAHINGLFCYATANDVILENGMTMLIDEIQYEK